MSIPNNVRTANDIEKKKEEKVSTNQNKVDIKYQQHKRKKN